MLPRVGQARGEDRAVDPPPAHLGDDHPSPEPGVGAGHGEPAGADGPAVLVVRDDGSPAPGAHLGLLAGEGRLERGPVGRRTPEHLGAQPDGIGEDRQVVAPAQLDVRRRQVVLVPERAGQHVHRLVQHRPAGDERLLEPLRRIEPHPPRDVC